MAASTASSEPAVREMNFRAIASFSHVSVGSDEVSNFAGSTPVLVDLEEEDIEIGSLFGVVTVPVAPEFGARAFLGAFGSRRHIDISPERETGGLEMGADIFWRNPEIGEIGIGPRYIWNEIETGGDSETNHSGGGELTASLFVPSFGIGPVDLDFVASVLDSEVDTDRDGSLTPGRTYAAAGGATLYIGDKFSTSLGGSWTRENAGNGENHITKSADLGAELLLPFKPAVTVGAALSFGEQDFSIANFSNYGTFFWSLGFSVAVSFPGGDSLVELNRFLY